MAGPDSPPDAADESRTEVLDPSACHVLLATRTIGRLGFDSDGYPTILPVNYAVVEQSIVIRSGPGGKLAAVRDAHVTFEVDDHDARTKTGWSVLVRAQAQVLDDAEEIARLEALELSAEPWDGGPHDHWIRLTLHSVTGRRVQGHVPPFDPTPGAYL